MSSRIAIVVGMVSMAAVALPFGPGILTGNDAGHPPFVRLQDPTGADITSFFAFDPSFTGGVRVAKADVNADGVPDMIVGAGPGGAPQVRVFDGSGGPMLGDFLAFDPSFSGGVYVAAGDVTGDGITDIVVGAGEGGQPLVRVFTPTGTTLGTFFAYGLSFAGGVRVAVGDVNGDGFDDIVTGPGQGMAPQVNLFRGPNFGFAGGFFAYEGGFLGGVYVAAGDYDGDGRAEIVTGPGPGRPGTVCRFQNDFQLDSFFDVFNSVELGVRVATGDVDGDGKDDILSVQGPGGGPNIQVNISGGNDQFTVVGRPEDYLGGLYVASNQLTVPVQVQITTPGRTADIPIEMVQLSLQGESRIPVFADFSRRSILDNGPFWTPQAFGQFSFYFKGPNTLSERVDGVTVFGGENLGPIPLRLGDVDGNDSINIADFIALRSSFGTSLGNVGFNPNADLNGDNSVNIADFIILRTNFGQSGDGR